MKAKQANASQGEASFSILLQIIHVTCLNNQDVMELKNYKEVSLDNFVSKIMV